MCLPFQCSVMLGKEKRPNISSSISRNRMRLRWSRDSCFHFCGEINSKRGLIRLTAKALSAHSPPSMMPSTAGFLKPFNFVYSPPKLAEMNESGGLESILPCMNSTCQRLHPIDHTLQLLQNKKTKKLKSAA